MSASIWAPGSELVVVDAESTNLSQIFTASAGQTVFNLTDFSYTIGTGSIAVYRGGQRLINGSDWLETSSTSITLQGITLADAEIIEVVAVLGSASAASIAAQAAAVEAVAAAAALSSSLWTSDVNRFGVVGDSSTDDTAALQALKTFVQSKPTAIVAMDGKRCKTTSSIWANNISPTLIYSDKPSVLGLFDGADTAPNTIDNDPALWVQKFSRFDNGTDRFAHNIGGSLCEVIVKGSGATGATDTDGTWIGILGNAVLNGVNQGSTGAPDFDAYGNAIGLAGFARATGYPGSGNIVCGMWGYAEGPTLDATTHTNLPATNWSLVGAEVNVQINHPDIGEQSVLTGKGSSVGFLGQNYRTPGTGVKDWTFGMLFGGTPNDGNYSSTDIDNWSGFYTGILIDKIKAKGIRFGQYFKNNSYGIYFPDSYAGSQEPAAAIYLGNSKFNLGQYLGATFNNQDLWHNGGGLFFKYSGVNHRLWITNASTGVTTTPAATNIISPGGTAAFAFGSVASSVNYVTAFGAAAGSEPALVATGSDADVDIELRPKGTGRVWVGAWTTNADAPITGYITVKDSSGVSRKIATIA